MTEETKSTKRRGPKALTEAEKRIPVFLRGKAARSSVTVKALCEGPDSVLYSQYLDYCEEATEGQAMTREELETRFNGAAWGSVWSKDAGFKAWQKKKAAEDAGADA